MKYYSPPQKLSFWLVQKPENFGHYEDYICWFLKNALAVYKTFKLSEVSNILCRAKKNI